jgi:hypothetical protein
MAIPIATSTTLSLTTGLKSGEQVSGDNQYVNRGRIQLIVKASAAAATGIRATLTCGGVILANDALVPFAGTTGTLDVNSNIMVDQMVQGGRVSLVFRNDSAGTLTVDYQLLYSLM